MALILPVKGVQPIMGLDCFLAPNATIVGDFSCGDHCSFWFNSVVRADVNAISLGDNVNVQDGAVIHCTYEKTKTTIGDHVSIGHNAIIHGCEIESNVLIGMGAIVMDNCVVKSGAIVAAGTVLLEGTIVEKGQLFAGVPGKYRKDVPAELRRGEIERIAHNYSMYSSWFKDQT